MAKDEIIKLRELASKLLGTEWDCLQKQKRKFRFLQIKVNRESLVYLA